MYQQQTDQMHLIMNMTSQYICLILFIQKDIFQVVIFNVSLNAVQNVFVILFFLQNIIFQTFFVYFVCYFYNHKSHLPSKIF